MTDSPAPHLNPALPEAPAPAGRPWYVSALLALVVVTLVLGGAWLFSRSRSAYPFFGTAYPSPPVATGFSGTGTDGRPYTFSPTGQTSAVFFGFTHCPNICPVTLSYLNKVRQALTPQEREQFQIVLVSVDPQRDTPARLREYVDWFGGGAAVNIPEPKLSEVARSYGVGYQQVEVETPEKYQINHTTATYLIDSAGRLRALWDYTQMSQVERVLADVRYVMRNPLQ
ncbi:protein SCO1/2 [Deinococcus reticulitermitis]|uniref:Protein SCO1/2 n=1 Tax=Deinococcus reticulitermitis TaxID=856736 RepID=A0A1H6T1T0_9DEIO|nr:SCO family protein [Deinococcus reticulitermitis]SEI69742.1 protein SCO1/2 [Deinococcus reticulitermitis]